MKEETYRLIMMVGLYIGIILFLVAIIVLVKNINEIKTDPIIYGMNKHDFPSCVCYDTIGRVTTIIVNESLLNSGDKG